MQVEKGEEQLAKIARTIRFDLEPNSLAATGAAQLLLDRAQQILRFFFVDVEIAVPRHAKGVDGVENQTREKVSDVMLDEGGQIDVFPWLIVVFAARQQDHAWDDPRDLNNGE